VYCTNSCKISEPSTVSRPPKETNETTSISMRKYREDQFYGKNPYQLVILNDRRIEISEMYFHSCLSNPCSLDWYASPSSQEHGNQSKKWPADCTKQYMAQQPGDMFPSADVGLFPNTVPINIVITCTWTKPKYEDGSNMVIFLHHSTWNSTIFFDPNWST